MERNVLPARPLSVTYAVYLLYLEAGLFLVGNVLEFLLPGGDRVLGSWGLIVFIPVVLLPFMIGKGKEWARITFLVLFIFGLIFSVVEAFNFPQISSLAEITRNTHEIIGTGIGFAALALLFRSTSSDWFGAVNGRRIPSIKGLIHELRSTDQPVLVYIWRNWLTALIPRVINLFKFMVSSLRNTDQPMLSYLWRAWLISLIPALVIGIIAVSVFGMPMPDDPAGLKFDERPTYATMAALVTAPWVETLLMWPVLAALRRIFPWTVLNAAISGVIFGSLHGIVAFAWGMATTWAFFAFSICFLEWRKKSRLRAIVMTALVHMCYNTPAILVMWLEFMFGN